MYSYETLTKMKGQALKDIWHSMIGKQAGLHNTTGLKTMDDVIEAILKGQDNPGFLEQFQGKAPKQISGEKEEDIMPRKKNPNPPVVPKKTVQAVESEDLPLQVSVQRYIVRKLIVGNAEYFKEKETNEVYTIENGRPGQRLGIWNPTTRSIVEA